MNGPEQTRSDSVEIALLKNEVHHLSWRVGHLQEALEDRDAEMKQTMARRDVEIKEELRKLVTHIEFSPIKQTVYGLVAGVLLAVMGALVATVVTR